MLLDTAPTVNGNCGTRIGVAVVSSQFPLSILPVDASPPCRRSDEWGYRRSYAARVRKTSEENVLAENRLRLSPPTWGDRSATPLLFPLPRGEESLETVSKNLAPPSSS